MSAGVLLPDDLEGDPVHVLPPEGEPHLGAGPGAEDPADGVAGGELLREGLLGLLLADEDEDLLGGAGEADLCVVLQRPDGVLPHLVAVDPGTWDGRGHSEDKDEREEARLTVSAEVSEEDSLLRPGDLALGLGDGVEPLDVPQLGGLDDEVSGQSADLEGVGLQRNSRKARR